MRVDEMPGLGVSGPYTLESKRALLNSERVEIITRDRNQPSLIVSIEPLQRFVDYTIEPYTGRLVFGKPIPSFDADQNPVWIRVTYEVESDGEEYWVVGTDAQLHLGSALTVGGGFVRDDAPGSRYELFSGNVGLRLGPESWLTAEAARSSGVGEGSGLRFEGGTRRGGLELRGRWIRVDEDFVNPGAGTTAGRTEATATGAYAFDDATRLEAEVIRSVDDRVERALSGGRVGLTRTVSGSWAAGVGWRWAAADSGATARPTAGEIDLSALGLSLEGRPSERTRVFTQFEQDVRDSAARRWEVGGDLRVTERAHLYARHELLSSLVGPYGLGSSEDRNATLVGVSAEYREGQSVFSEYRIGNAISGHGAQAAIGLRNGWELRDGVHLHTTLERVRAVSNDASDAFSVTGAMEFLTSPLWKGTVRGEYRTANDLDQLFTTVGVARRLGRDWTMLAQSSISSTLDGGPFHERTRVGLAYRSTGERSWGALGRYEHRTDREPDGAQGPIDRRSHTVAAHLNLRWTDAFVTSARWATRAAEDRAGSSQVLQVTHLLAGRATLDLTSRLDLTAIGRTLFDTSRRYGVGLEGGVALSDDLRFSVGYNLFGFRSGDLLPEEITDRGFHFGLGWRFDEGIFGMGRVGRQ